MKKLGFMEVFFRLVAILFWPLYWYNWSVITIANYNRILFTIYLCISVSFLFVSSLEYLFRKSVTKNYFYYRTTLIVTYLESLYSFMIEPKNIDALYIKVGLCILLIFVSNRLIKKDNNDTGVVGLMSAVLLLVLTYFY